MHRFFISASDQVQDLVVLTGENASHGNVLRLRQGEEIVVAPGDGVDIVCQVITVEKREITARVLRMAENLAELPMEITLFQALPKGDKMTDIIENTVELGIHRIVPVETERCIVRNQNKTARWEKVAEASAKLSHRAYIPKISGVCGLDDAIAQANELDNAFVCYEGEKSHHLSQYLQNKNPKTLGFFIGPEGGFTTEEIKKFEKHNIEVVTLGNRILRTISASAAALAGINFYLGV
ncbi:MAG: 16S rRNA (uracil(1498)-N(3))-methyltransferase [Defluviitaleaceae bacterium]|nr:16S rRNA (uracil(1498)-N(3))-methyltransferase [Defluviitaleaceae bacterium]